MVFRQLELNQRGASVPVAIEARWREQIEASSA
jgi:hypothetical protein